MRGNISGLAMHFFEIILVECELKRISAGKANPNGS